jgi:hypothetical protein
LEQDEKTAPNFRDKLQLRLLLRHLRWNKYQLHLREAEMEVMKSNDKSTYSIIRISWKIWV